MTIIWRLGIYCNGILLPAYFRLPFKDVIAKAITCRVPVKAMILNQM